MRCPVCDVALSMADRQGIEIDFCPDCRGVWLDRGELDKIIERSIGEATPPPPPRTPDQRYDDDDRGYRSGKHGGGHHGGYGKHGSRRKSWLHELFD
ncbi:zf-TFIIB domain-containing protein [Sulfitobacter sp.]|uniref:TFIIB-type zinc ribbon-containing protein n=1 Tax=Sulfitobacter sp. TaxID=1903071 RepID=UPI003299BCAF